jgi:hypothetical protein
MSQLSNDVLNKNSCSLTRRVGVIIFTIARNTSKAHRAIVAATTLMKTVLAVTTMILILEDSMKAVVINSAVLVRVEVNGEMEDLFHPVEEGVEEELIETMALVLSIPKTKTIRVKRMRIPHLQIVCL